MPHSPEFKLYIIKDYQRLKKDEADRLAIGWDVKRELSKINYRIHTDAVKEFLITPTLSQQEMAYTYASEADILNMALFGKTASQWRSEKGIKGKNSNIRDFASAEELVVLINLEDTNADLIRKEVPKIERLKILREKAYRQLELLKKNQDTIEAYLDLLMSCRLNSYLADIEEQAQGRFERIIEQMKQAQGITEQLKADNAWEWVGRMNNIQACAREIVNRELIYQ